jgi:hypothetical protein
MKIMQEQLSFRGTATYNARDGGYAEIAGANFCPYILYITAPPSLAPCEIPYILYIKKPSEEGLLLKHLLLFLIRNRS